MSPIKRFTISGLHGLARTIDIFITDNRLILIGENGTGKSTVLNLLYYTLTRQWRRLSEFKFATISVDLAENSIELTHEDVETLASYRRGQYGHDLLASYPPSARRMLMRAIEEDQLRLPSGQPDLHLAKSPIKSGLRRGPSLFPA